MGNNNGAREQSHAEALQHPALVRNIARRLAMAEIDAVRVIDYVLARLEKGRDEHGDLDLATDARDLREEERQEHADLIVYRACAEIQRLDRERAPLREAARRELMASYSPAEHGASFHLGTAPGDAPISVATQATREVRVPRCCECPYQDGACAGCDHPTKGAR